MKFNNLIISIGLALLTTIALRLFFGTNSSTNQQTSIQSGQKFTAPQAIDVEINKPLNVEVDFINIETRHASTITFIETAHARYSFSSEGASLKHAEFKKKTGNNQDYLSTIFPPASIDRARSCFLVAFNEKTPYYFSLKNKEESDEAYTLTYQTDLEGGAFYKTFTVHKNTYQIDLTLSFDIKSTGASLQPRIFFANPIVPELEKNDTVTGIVNTASNKIVVNQKNEEILNTFWSKPTLFGSQDRYFLHALVQDHNEFVQRAYYKSFDLESLYSILEGPTIGQTGSWKLSFYVGPKTDGALHAVDQRLIQTLNYGYLAPISRPISKVLLKILTWLYSYCKNYGVAIIILTLIMKLFLTLLNFNDSKNVKKKNEFNKKLKHLEEKYKHDKAALNAARAELIAKNGIPGLSGCLPLLLQMPLFIALSIVISNSIEFYQAPFLWISDLTAADPYFILPILTAAVMLFHSPILEDPKKSMNPLMFALLFGAITASLSAGVALYFFINTLFTALQTKISQHVVVR